MHYENSRYSAKIFMITFWTIFSLSSFSLALCIDLPTETGLIQKVGRNFISVVIKGGKGFKDGTKLTFYLHPKTMIIMAGSEAPLVLDSLVSGDQVQLTLGKVKKTKDGKIIRFVNSMVVSSGHRTGKHKKNLKQGNKPFFTPSVIKYKRHLGDKK